MYRFIFTLTFLCHSLLALETHVLNKGKLLFHTDFSEQIPIKKPRFWIKQNTRWKVKNGELVGTPATMEYQKKKKNLARAI
ncbi:hypothetical protein LNTAR_19467 [Lentisphaera araneosa HTCC2155]|uniref:Uncharacterized protein n=1 Tax=Lentisphaera araneosa HTCC2155 TaxID=313628 RepID=A6DQV9_9BACT|nr:hypothetical protein LNTAR_19467 [Lentisphaera araneosa HTCC2155]